ncbi:GtrA family protein [Altererythrobacter sp. JGD-16]|uniref:GtrA family protein n=2 Tax=Altererythrobacter lutimaris TaxID=2743979 RepID=A0A850HBZ0_9SPHN|nr:GtrA family protein [Altererythrobacter lutimaris]NVE95279.1 GtrA family protein [Altererythrobacter lutimaris]
MWLAKLRDVRFVRYVLASVGALAADVGAFLGLLAMGMAAAPASAIGYSIGIIVHWLFSSRAVFHETVAQERGARTWQKTLFVLSALVGLGLTTAIVGLGDAAGFDPRLAKLAAIAVSFTATWLLRAQIVFREPKDAVPKDQLEGS